MSVKSRISIKDYLKIGTDSFEFAGTGFTKLDETPSAQTNSKRYISMKTNAKSITGYDDSFPFEADQVDNEGVIAYLVGIGEGRKTGSDAETEYVRVDITKKVGVSGTEFEARKFTVAVEISDMPDSDGELTISGNLLPNGDPVEGKFDTTTKKFTPTV